VRGSEETGLCRAGPDVRGIGDTGLCRTGWDVRGIGDTGLCRAGPDVRGSVNWIHVALDRVHLWDFVKAVLKFWGSYSYEVVSFLAC
jgi:hypothetical protein